MKKEDAKLRRQEYLRTTTLREFDGGWDIVDNDLNLAPKYANVLENMYRRIDGSIGLRYGTTLFDDVSVSRTITGTIDGSNISCVIATNVITIHATGHGFYSGHVITLSGLTRTVSGIYAGELNRSHVITVIDEDNYTFTVVSTASSSSTWVGNTATYVNTDTSLSGSIVNIAYFQESIIVADTNGEIAAVDYNGNATVIWNASIASFSTGGVTAGWSATKFVSFATFGGKLLVCNGIDKPLSIDLMLSLPCQYLFDPASGSNANTPVARYIVGMNEYVVMAGDPVNPSRLHISGRGQMGTYSGDPSPNDATYLDLDTYVTSTDFVITGIGRFRDKLIVAFIDATIVTSLGTYDDSGTHIPDLSNSYAGYGSIAPRSLASIGTDFLMCDHTGVPSLQEAVLTEALRPTRASQLIDSAIQADVHQLTRIKQEDYIFSVFNTRDGQYMLFIPNAAGTQMNCYVFTVVESLKIRAWALFTGWNFCCACQSSIGRTYFGVGSKLYRYGAIEEPVFDDFIGDASKAPITFDWQLPWADFGVRTLEKLSRYAHIDSEGKSQFKLELFVDNFLIDQNGDYTPKLTLDLVGGGVRGYGYYDQPYGGGRQARDERPWAFPAHFKIGKLRIHGSSSDGIRDGEDLVIISISIMYQVGSLRR